MQCSRFRDLKVLPGTLCSRPQCTPWSTHRYDVTPGAGDEARGVKQLHGKCISCDRPLNVQRQNRLGDLPSIMDAFSTHKSRPKGPGWESAPNRALGNGDAETAAELRCARLRRS